MTFRTILVVGGVWLIHLLMAVSNGIARDVLYKEWAGESRAHQISSLTLIFSIFLVTYFFLKLGNAAYRNTHLFLIGAIWLVLTLAFEFLFFHYVRGESWQALWANYNVMEGRLWPFVLLATFFAPFLINKILR